MLGNGTTVDGAAPKKVPPHQENHLPPGDNNGYFVRPVAVANIFKPALATVEDVSKKPAVPEKRRFSVLAGDLQPCKTVSTDEVARRRQSWDVRSVAPPFGQDLLKKTPKRTSLTKENEQLISSTSSLGHTVVEKKSYAHVNGECNGNDTDERKEDQNVNFHNSQQNNADKGNTINQNAVNENCASKRSSRARVKTDLPQIAEDNKCSSDVNIPERRRQRSRSNHVPAENEVDCSSPVRRRSRADRDRMLKEAAEKCHLENGNHEATKLSNGSISSEEYKSLPNSHNSVTNDRSSQVNAAVALSDAKPRVRVYGLSKNSNTEASTQSDVIKNAEHKIISVTESKKSTEVISSAQKVDVSEPPKSQNKVYGVVKRGSKTESTIVAESNSVISGKNSVVNETKELSSVASKTSMPGKTGVKTPAPEKIDPKTTVPEKTDPKITAPEKTPLKTPVPEKSPLKTPVLEKTPLKMPVLEKTDVKAAPLSSVQHSDSKLETKVDQSKPLNTVILREKPSTQLDSNFVEIPKNVRTARRTSDVIAAKIQSIFSSTDKSVVGNSATKLELNSSRKTVIAKSTTIESNSKDTTVKLASDTLVKPIDKPALIEKELNEKCVSKTNEIDNKKTLLSKEDANKPIPKTNEIVSEKAVTNKTKPDKPVLKTNEIVSEKAVTNKTKPDGPVLKANEIVSEKVVTNKVKPDKPVLKANEIVSEKDVTNKVKPDKPVLKANEIVSGKDVTNKVKFDKPVLKTNEIASEQAVTNKVKFDKPVPKTNEIVSEQAVTNKVKPDKPFSKTSEIVSEQAVTNKVKFDKPVPKTNEIVSEQAVTNKVKYDKPVSKTEEIINKQTVMNKEDTGKPLQKVIEIKKSSNLVSLTKQETFDKLKNIAIREETNKVSLTKNQLDKVVMNKDKIEPMNKDIEGKLSSKKVLTDVTIKKCTETTENLKQPLSNAHIKESEKLVSSKFANSASKVSGNEASVLSISESTVKNSEKFSASKFEEKSLVKISGKEMKVPNNDIIPKSLNKNTACEIRNENSTLLSQVNTKFAVPEKKSSSTLKTIQNSSAVQASIDSPCLINGPSIQKKTLDLSEKISYVETASPKCLPKVSSATAKANSIVTNHIQVSSDTKTAVANCDLKPKSMPSITSTKPVVEKQCLIQSTATSTNLTKNVQKCLPQQEVKSPCLPEQDKVIAVTEETKQNELVPFEDTSKSIVAEDISNKTNTEEVQRNGKHIPSNEPSVRPKNSINKSFYLNMESYFKSAAKNLDCCTSPPETETLDFKTVSLSNLATPLSSNLTSKENSMDLINGSSSSMESVSSDAPKPPERKRASILREASSSPSHSTTVTRAGSLKRFDDPTMTMDKSLSILRSPSHSTLPTSYNPHRYSYTEMLSKVCSYGISPSTTSTFNPPYKKYSYGSLSSSLSQVAELRSDLLHEQSSSTHTSEMLESETTERMRLEKEVSELQSRYNHVQKKSNKMEMKMMEARVYRSPEINGEISDDEEVSGNASLYKQKYEKAVQDMEIMKRRMQQQREEEMEQSLLTKKAADKKLAEALEDVEEEKQVANQWKRKAQKLGSELQDLRLMLEEQMARNGELEKKQRGFDAELHVCKEEIKKERLLREKVIRERDQAQNEKYALEQELHTTRLDMDEKIIQLKQELDELTLSSKGEEEVTQLKRAKQEIERKYRDLEEELEEYVDRSNMLEQAKLRLEMSLEKLRQEHRRESSVREEEIEELRASFSKKIKNLEAQVESEQEERHQLVKQKHELERRVIELTDQPPPQDPEIERRLRRDLKRTKALLRDSQAMLDRVRDGQGSKSVVRQLKNQLEDAEFAKCSALKAKQTAEMELQELQTQLEEVTRHKNDHESRCLLLSREKSALQTQVEEAEEEMNEIMNKYEALVARMSTDQKLIGEQNHQIAELEAEKNALRDQLSEVNTKFEHLAGQTEDTQRTFRLDAKVRDLDSKLELEQTSRTRLEHQITRLKEQIDRLQEECDSLRNKELQAQEGTRRFQRQVRELREDYAALQQKEAEAYRKQHELETALENAEGELKVTKNDLRLACQRIEELKNALEDDLDSGTDVPDDSGSDSDSSLDVSTMMRPSFTPIQRCDSAASDLSFGSRRSVTPSYGDIASLCRGMWRRTSMDFLT